MSKIWNVAVVGCGIGRAHIERGYAKHPDKFRVLALCDLDEGRLEVVGKEFAVPRRIRWFDDILRMDDVDIIDVCTPPALHVPQSVAALAAGKHVVCEKPLAGSLADADRLIAVESTARGRLMPVFQYRFGDGLQKARHIIQQGLAGRAYLATVETAWSRTADYYAVPWRGRWGTELGGVLVSQAIHSHDLLTHLMGPIASVFARMATRVNQIEAEDCTVASLVMQNGALASLSATLGSHKEISRLRFCFQHVTFENCLKPYAPGDEPWEIVPATSEVAGRIERVLADWTSVPTGYEGLMERYHQALETGGTLPVTLADARRSLELITALYDSAERGQPVILPIGAEHSKYESWRPQ
jgi:predicted dehydrogenase